MKKKTKIILAILALVLVFCLWYTRPRSFEDLAGDGKIKSISVTTTATVFTDGSAGFDVWTVDDRDGPESVCEELGAIMKSCKYRVSLRSLLVSIQSLFSDGYPIPGDESAPMIHVAAVLEDDNTVFAIYKGATVTFMVDSAVIAKASDKEIGDKLLAYVQEFGWNDNQ